jgi:plastocyanin
MLPTKKFYKILIRKVIQYKSIQLHYLTNFKNQTSTAVLLFLLIALAVVASPLLYSKIAYAAGTFPPGILYNLRAIPSYAITIPYSSLTQSSFEPADVSIPLGMTVIWFNDDTGTHSVTTVSNSTYSPPQTINAFLIANGGSFTHTFSKPGVYDYYDTFNPSMHGRVTVVNKMETGKNMVMQIGGKLPFNAGKLRSMVLSFVPTKVSLPPTIALTYYVTLLNSTGKTIFGHRYDTADGILDMELVPHKSKNATDFVTWGPDFRSQESLRTTGTFHIKGPVMVENSPYYIRVSIVDLSKKIISNPLIDTFALLPQQSSAKQATNATSTTTTGGQSNVTTK